MAGVWVAFNHDGSACVVFAEELHAYRYAASYHMSVQFVPWGHDAINGKAEVEPGSPVFGGA